MIEAVAFRGLIPQMNTFFYVWLFQTVKVSINEFSKPQSYSHIYVHKVYTFVNFLRFAHIKVVIPLSLGLHWTLRGHIYLRSHELKGVKNSKDNAERILSLLKGFWVWWRAKRAENYMSPHPNPLNAVV